MSKIEFLMIPLRRNWRRITQTWKLYRRSKIGLIGLSIMVVFVILATFAPIIAPYDPQYAAPNEDVFVADTVKQPLNATINGVLVMPLNETWNEPVPSYGLPPDSPLETVTVYSSDGHAIRYEIDVTTTGQALGMELQLEGGHGIPKNTTYLKWLSFVQQHYVAISGSTYYELSYSTFDTLTYKDIGFDPIYYSNLWWSPSNPQERVCLVVANSTAVFMAARAPKGFGETQPKYFYDSMEISSQNANTTDLQIIGNPIVILDQTLVNGNVLIVPTDKALLAYEIVVRGNTTLRITDEISIGNVTWFVDYEELGENLDISVDPVERYTIAIENPDPKESQSKHRIVLASNPAGKGPGHLFAFWRENGTMDWWSTLTVPELRTPLINGVFTTSRKGYIVTAYQGFQSLIAKIDAEGGRIGGNFTEYFTGEGKIVSVPDFVYGNKRFVYSTDQDKVYMLRENLDLDVVFSITEGIQVPASFLGNIMTEFQIAGNYYCLINNDGVLFIQSLTGSYVAPLPPGYGKSGNLYILGTDVFGHDIFTQLIYGTQNELIVGLTAALIAVGLGTLIGLIAGYFGGIIDSVLMRFTDIFLTLPVLVIALLLAAVLGPSLLNLIIVIAVFSWAGIARVIRAQTLSLKERDFIKASKVAGAGHRQILFRHLAPNVIPFTFLYMAYTISGAIVTEAILSFLGMGDPTSITWGMMLQYLRISGHTLDAPWWFLPPGIAITLLSLSFYLIGRAFDEVVNPRLRAR